MEVLFCDSAKGSAPYNQDIYGSNGTIYWVIDGATALYDSRFTNDDVHYAVTVLNQELREVDTTLPLNTILRSAIQMASQRITAVYPDFLRPTPGSCLHLHCVFAALLLLQIINLSCGMLSWATVLSIYAHQLTPCKHILIHDLPKSHNEIKNALQP